MVRREWQDFRSKGLAWAGRAALPGKALVPLAYREPLPALGPATFYMVS